MYRIGDEEIAAVSKVIHSGRLFRQLDPTAPTHEVLDCESEMRTYLNTQNYFLLTSGKGALICGLVGLGVGPGDEVIVPAYTYIATALAVTAVGAIPVVAEIDDTLCMDPADVEKKISAHTKAIIPVHMQGRMCDMDAMMAIGKKYGISVLEDACQAFGAEYHGMKAGTIGDAGAYSYNYFKNISAGEGGGFTAHDEDVFKRAYIQHDSSGVPYFGANIENIDELVFGGSEFRCNEIQAAIMRVQLTRLPGILSDLRRCKNYLEKKLEGTGLKLTPDNDKEGVCGNILAFKFNSIEESAAFAEKAGCSRPINMGRHIYSEWGPILHKRGAYHDGMNAYKMKANQGLNMDLTVDSCKRSLEILAKNAYLGINPDWTNEEMDAVAEKVAAAVK